MGPGPNGGPIRVNSGGEGRQRWSATDPGRNPQNLNNRFKNSTSPMRDMMRGIMGKARETGSKLMAALKNSNATLLIARQARQFVPSACAQEMIQIQSDCFSKNGYSMDTFFHSLRNGSLSPSEKTMDDIKVQLCR